MPFWKNMSGFKDYSFKNTLTFWVPDVLVKKKEGMGLINVFFHR